MKSKGTPVTVPLVDSSNIGLNIRTPRCECSVCEEELQHKPHLTHQQRPRFADYDDLQVNLDKMTDHQYSLCDSHVFGYILNDRTWGNLDLNVPKHCHELTKVQKYLQSKG